MSESESDDSAQHSQLLANMEGIYCDSGKSSSTEAACPVCRKPHLLNLDQLQVNFWNACGLEDLCCLLVARMD